MDKLKLVWTSTALRERNYIFEFWNKHNQNLDYSRKLNKRIKGRLEHLKSHPLMGTQTTFKNTRTISLGHYSLFYQIIETKIIITAFWDNRQNPQTLLKFLINKET